MGPSRRRLAPLFALLIAGCATADGVDPYGPPVDDLGGLGDLDAGAVADDATEAGALDAGPRCTRDDECAGGVCDLASGRCGACSPADDRCAPGFVCDAALLACARGCSGDEDCTAPTTCDTATRRCTGCVKDNDCALGTLCREGVCVAGCTEARGCGVGLACCGGACVDPQADRGHCGACGVACAAGAACCGGACVDTAGSAEHCGQCGRSCSAANGVASCAAGACAVASCNAGFGDCDGDAANGCEVDLSGSSEHCGACRNTCATGANAAGRCEAGLCRASCNAGFGDCDGDAANGCEVELASSPAHCGACGSACPARANAVAVCSMGQCGATCVAGRGDCDGDAANGCEVDLNADPAQCGTCGAACRVANATASCAAGVCGIASCLPGFADCDGDAANGCEQDIGADSTNCGGCGRRCGVGTACQGGLCVSLCGAGTTFCTDRCARLSDDPSHCGACGNACPGGSNASPNCAGGRCALLCATGYGDCNGSPGDGCEASLRDRVDHCGACGARCDRANATSVCSNGACRVGACATGFATCDGVDENGCETNLTADVQNCGACGRRCSLANAGATCDSGVCAVGSCSPGFANCNGVASDGCEINTASDNFNCGACGVSCAPGTACSGGSCRSTCAPGTTYCSGGCVDLQTNSNHCNGCGRVCPAGQSCVGGACTQPGPANDLCGGATTVPMSSTQWTTTGSNAGAAGNLAAPCGFNVGTDVWFRFTIPGPSRELVYADTFGSSFDTVLFFASSCGAALSGSTTSGDALCNDDSGSVGCVGGLQSQVTALLNPGTYYLVLGGYNGASGSYSLRFQHLAVGNGAVGQIGPGSSSLAGFTSGSGQIVGCTGSGPEQSWWWRTCPSSAAGTLSASTCSASWDTVLYLRNGDGGGGACNDDSCGLQSSLSGAVTAGAGIHTLTLDGFGSASGSATVSVTRP
ncbi:MAG: hypothetical protein R3A48_12245 [Polyangiales bacterium]